MDLVVRFRPVELAVSVFDVAVEGRDRRVDQPCYLSSPWSILGSVFVPYLIDDRGLSDSSISSIRHRNSRYGSTEGGEEVFS
ncbi:MAG: hypothetical protein C0P76_009025 [Acidimicrobiia bacterium]|nr:hypothetical protein [Acidimicrobiia bacterium]